MANNRILTIPDFKSLFMGGYRGWHTKRSGIYALSTSSNIQYTRHCPCVIVQSPNADVTIV